MRMLNICGMDDLIANSMNILEPAPVDANGNDREDGQICKTILISLQLLLKKSIKALIIAVMLANEPVDLLLLPGNFSQQRSNDSLFKDLLYLMMIIYLDFLSRTCL